MLSPASLSPCNDQHWNRSSKRIENTLNSFSHAVCCCANKFTKLMWLKTWEPGALWALIKSGGELEAFFEGLEVALGAGGRAVAVWWGLLQGGCGSVLVLPLQLQPAHPELWHRECHWLTAVLLWPGYFCSVLQWVTDWCGRVTKENKRSVSKNKVLLPESVKVVC